MKILIVVGQNLLGNSSASLCHLSYIRGFIETQNDIDILTVSTKNNSDLPEGPNYYYFKADRIYHRLYRKIRYRNFGSSSQQHDNDSSEVKVKKYNFKETILSCVKRITSIRSAYATKKIWGDNASKYKSDKEYDFILSLSWPSISHYTVGKLIELGRIKSKCWCQLLEDPWALDLYGEVNKKVKKAEAKLLSYNCKILYITPGTLENQQKNYSSNSNKMDWLPLPSYYSRAYPETNNKNLVFSYFGDYFFTTRNLKNFYNVAKEERINTYICGNSDKPFGGTDNVKVMPRMDLCELERYENITDVLVFVANIGGGQIPGEIYQYSATSKIILFILDGNEHEKQVLKEYFSQFNRYVFCDNNEKDIKNAIDAIRNNKIENIKNDPVSAFTPKEIAQAIINRYTRNKGD